MKWRLTSRKATHKATASQAVQAAKRGERGGVRHPLLLRGWTYSGDPAPLGYVGCYVARQVTCRYLSHLLLT